MYMNTMINWVDKCYKYDRIGRISKQYEMMSSYGINIASYIFPYIKIVFIYTY